MVAHERLELGNDFRVPTQREIRVDPHLRASQPKLLEAGDLGLGEALVADVGKGGSAPEGQGTAQGLRRSGRVAVRELVTTSRREFLETLRIAPSRFEQQSIAAWLRKDDIRADDLAQPRNEDLNGVVRILREAFTPELLDRPVDGNCLGWMDQEESEERARPPARQLEWTTFIVERLDRPEDSELQATPP